MSGYRCVGIGFWIAYVVRVLLPLLLPPGSCCSDAATSAQTLAGASHAIGEEVREGRMAAPQWHGQRRPRHARGLWVVLVVVGGRGGVEVVGERDAGRWRCRELVTAAAGS